MSLLEILLGAHNDSDPINNGYNNIGVLIKLGVGTTTVYLTAMCV